MKRSVRSGFTLIELLVVIAIIAILLALLMPAVQRVRESANRTDCINKMKQIGIGLHNYYDQEIHFPAGVMTQAGGNAYGAPPVYDSKAYFSWMCRILPYMEQTDVYDKIDFNAWPWWQHPWNEQPVLMYHCTSDSRGLFIADYQDNGQSQLVALTGFLGVNGTDQLAYNGMLYANSKVTFKMITDGASNTLMAGERPPSDDFVYGWWMAGSGDSPYFGATDVVLGTNENMTPGAGATRDIYRDGTTNDPSNQHRWHYWSTHPHGSNFLFADGSVHFIGYDIGQPTLNALGTRNGDETLNLPAGF